MFALKNLSSQVKKSVLSARHSLTEGWQDLLRLSSGALTHFEVSGNAKKDAEVEEDFPRWSLLAAETWETAQSVIIRMEMPGVDSDDIKVCFNKKILQIQGEKRFGSDSAGRSYGLRERAYGRFERRLGIYQSVDPAAMEVSYRDGVLTVILKKTTPIPPQAES